MINLINENSVLTGIEASTKRQLLQNFANEVAQKVNLDSDTIYNALLERESLGTTGFGQGTAIPHARLANLDKVYTFFVKLDLAIDFDSVDNKPADLFFFLLSPEESGADHLTALAKASRLLKSEELCKKIRTEDRDEVIYALLSA